MHDLTEARKHAKWEVDATAIAWAQDRIEALETALREIASMKPERITPEFTQGPQLLLDACQRIARKALRKLKQK